MSSGRPHRTGPVLSNESEALDLAIIGAGAAGTYVADEIKAIRPDWEVGLFERTDRVGGRLRSRPVGGIPYPIELGGMRYLSSHRRVQSVVAALGISTHPFPTGRGPDRFYLRGRLSEGPADPAAGAGYALADDERGQSAVDLVTDAFERIVPGAHEMGESDWRRVRATGAHQGRPLIDWPIGEALASVLSPEGHRFVTDAFGYDSGLRGLNAGDAIPYMLGAGDPTARALVPDAGMDTIPRQLADRFVRGGGLLHLQHELQEIDVIAGLHRLCFLDGRVVHSKRTVLALTAPALRALQARSPLLSAPTFAILPDTVDAWQAVKFYAWYERPWWREGFAGARTTTDLPIRKSFYFGDPAPGSATLLVSYTDGDHSDPWVQLAKGRPPGGPAPDAMLRAAHYQLRNLHPATGQIPEALGSAVMHWGADPNETGWHYWRAGIRSDDVIASAVQPEPSLSIFLCGEAFSRAQAWVEGAFETAAVVVERLTA